MLMEKSTIINIAFLILVPLALVFDLGLLSRKNKVIGFRAAIKQTLFWVALSMGFCLFIWYENDGGNGTEDALAFLSAYLLEWSLSVDNIFVFIIIFSFFRVKEQYYSRVLLLGILMAIFFRILFIALGTELVERFSWVMYLFGIFLVYTGIKLFSKSEEAEFNPEENRIYRFMKKFMRTTGDDGHGRFVVMRHNKAYFTQLSMVVVMLGLIDLLFAIDSIPAVFSIIPDPDKKLLIYSSNIFAVLGLRSMFFLLRGAASKFDYLQQGIAIVLVLIGLKMLAARWVHVPVWAFLPLIVLCIGGSVWYSIYHKRKGAPADVKR